MKQNNLLQALLDLKEQAQRKSIRAFLPLLLIAILIAGCSETANNDTTQANEVDQTQEVKKMNTDVETVSGNVQTEEPASSDLEQQAEEQSPNTREFNGVTYRVIELDGGDLSGDKKANVAVSIGFGDREYWAYTNEYRQLVYVTADNIIL